jgi:hypothetical protein
MRFDLVRVATPLPLSVADPMVKVSVKNRDLNRTFPVGVTEPDDVTFAVQLTFCPEGFRLEVSEVDVVYLLVGFTTCLSTGDVLAPKVESPG